MDLNKMSYFLEIARLKSYSEAAKKLHISQSYLSKILKALEKEIGSKLIDSSNKHTIKLTVAGQHLYTHGNHLLRLSEDIETKCRDLEAGVKGVLSIGTHSYHLGKTLTKTLKPFVEKHKDVSYQMLDLDKSTILNKVVNGTLDFGIVKGPFNSTGLEVVELPKTSYILIGKEKDISSLEPFCLDMLSKLKLVLSTKTKEILSKQIANLEENILCECSDESNIIPLVEAGMSFGVVEKEYFDSFNCPNLSSIKLQITDETKTSLIYLKENFKNPIVENFLNELEENLPLIMRGKILFNS